MAAAVVALHLDESRLWLRGLGGEIVSGRPTLGMGTDGALRWAPEIETRPFESSVVRFLDADHLIFDNIVVSVPDALTAAFAGALAQSGCSSSTAKAVLTCPMHWGESRTAVVRQAVGRLFGEVEVHAAALSPAVVRAARRGSVSGSVRCLVVETTPLTMTIGYVVYDHDGGRIQSCEHAPSLGEADIGAGTGAQAELRALLARTQMRRVVDVILVLGEVSESMVEAIGAVARRSISPLIDVRRVGGRELVETEPHIVSGISMQAVDGSSSTVRTDIAPLGRRRWLGVAVVAVIVVVLAMGALASSRLFHHRIGDFPQRSDQNLTVGRVTFGVPLGWRIRPSIAGESSDVVRLVPVDGHRRRIEITQNGLRGDPTLEQVAVDLQAQIRSAGGIYGPLHRETFGRRAVLTYHEIERDNSEVAHHVIVVHGAQVTVDCQYVTGEWGAIVGACAHVVASIDVGP